MYYEKYYKLDNEGYTLHFSNKKKFSVSEIQEIFSAFGKVVAVNITGKKDGFRFVKYKTLDETICCIKGLANSNNIQLLPEKSKMNDFNNRSDKKNSSQWQAARTEYSSQITSGKQHLNSAHNEKYSEIESSTHNIKIFNEHNRFDNVDNLSDTGSKSSTCSFKANVNAIKYDKSNALESNSLSSRKQNFVDNSNKIDFEKYYKIIKDGNYVIHFANKKELSLKEINKLFSSYGNVISVNFSGNRNNGLVFVKYKTLQEIITCLEALQNNPVICILPQKDKIDDTMKKTEQRNSYHWQPTETQDSFQETSKQSNSNYDKKYSEAEKKLIYNTTIDQDKFDNTNNILDIDSQSSNHGYKSAITYSDSLIFNGQHSLSRQKSSINCQVSDYDLEQQQKNKFHSFTKQTSNTYMDKAISDQIPALISDTEIKQKKFDAMSNSSSMSSQSVIGSKNASSNVMIIPMQEIIVANIHANYDVHYILHLFKKYDPISATLVETILDTNIRYCRVYFKTIQDVVTIEEEFDNFDLFGKNLIVLRISRLMEEATNSCK
ncbi:hypothetical protein ACFW04_007997 [Cataglyphis niger]